MDRSNSPSTTRRALLAAAVSAGSGTVGCLDRPFGPDPPPFGPVDHGWPMAGRDPANTAHNPGASGPRREPEVVWELEFDQQRTPRVVIDGNVLAATDDQTLHVFDLDAGELAWTADVDARFHTPVVTATHLYTRTGQATLTAFDVDSGEQVWAHESDVEASPYNFTTPKLRDGLVYAVAGGTVSALAAADGTVKWRTELDSGGWSTLATDDGVLYVGYENRLGVLDAADGSELVRVPEVGGHPVVADGTAYLGGSKLRALQSDGSVLWVADSGTGGYSAPAVAGDRVYVTDDGVETRNSSGELRWTARPKSGIAGRPVVDSTTVYVGSTYFRRAVFGIDASDGTDLWERSVPEAATCLRVVDDLLFVGIATGRLLALAAR